MKTEQQKSNAGYTTFIMSVIVSLIFGLTASLVMAADHCNRVNDGHKRCEGKADPATTGECTGACSPDDTCEGQQTEYDYTSCDECTSGGTAACEEYASPRAPAGCETGPCTIKERTKDCQCYGPLSNETCGIDPADNTDWDAPESTDQDECV